MDGVLTKAGADSVYVKGVWYGIWGKKHKIKETERSWIKRGNFGDLNFEVQTKIKQTFSLASFTIISGSKNIGNTHSESMGGS